MKAIWGAGEAAKMAKEKEAAARKATSARRRVREEDISGHRDGALKGRRKVAGLCGVCLFGRVGGLASCGKVDGDGGGR